MGNPRIRDFCVAVFLTAICQANSWCDESGRTSGATAIKPPMLEGDKVVRQLPGLIRDVSVGGGGRYLILHLPALRQLSIFDVNEAKIVGNVSLPENWIKFASGMDKLIVVLPEKKIIQRWNLQTLDRELSVYSPFKGKVLVLALGCASIGPAVVYAGEVEPGDWSKGQFALLNIQTMRRMDVGLGRAKESLFEIRGGTHLRSSADGRVLGQWGLNYSNSFILVGKELKPFTQQYIVTPVVPSSDGNFVMTGTGVYTNEMKAVHLREGDIGRYVPACHGKFYLGFGREIFPAAPMIAPMPGGPQPLPQRRVHIYLQGEERPLATLNNVEMPGSDNSLDFSFDKHVHFIPQAKLIITIPFTDDRLILHRFDADEALERSNIDYILITSEPPFVAKKGQTYLYQAAVKSRKGEVKYRLDSNPKGMQINEKGLITWRVPADFVASESAVILSARNGSGREVFQRFTLCIEE